MAWKTSKTSSLTPQIVAQVDRGVDIMREGGVVAFPTDTVYGLGASAFNLEAAERIYEIKQRPRSAPFPILIADKEQLVSVAEVIPEIARVLIDHFWPGGLTLVLVKSVSLHGSIAVGDDRIAVRLPDNVITIALIRGLGVPVIGTSANISGKPNILTAQEVKRQLGDRVDLVIDGGKCPGGVESTVVDVTGGVPVILRQGIIVGGEIEEVCKGTNIKEVKRSDYRSGL